MRLEPYLCLAGTEIANANRTLAYVKRLAPRTIQVRGSLPTITGSPGNYTVVGGLCSHCLAYSDEPEDGHYLGPAEDDAPWYDDSRPESAEFLGLWLRDARLRPFFSRDVAGRGAEGASLGPLNLGGRSLSAIGTVYATTARGMAYGEAWLAEALAGSYCRDGVERDDLEILRACPGEGSLDASGFRTLFATGITSGPEFSPLGVDETLMQEVAFQLQSELPWLYRAPVEVFEESVGASQRECGLAEVPLWPGDGALRIRVQGVAAQSFVFTIEAKVSLDGTTTDPQEGMPCWRALISVLDVDEAIVIDAARRRVYLEDPTTKTRRPADERIFVEELLEWPDVPPCSTLAVCVDMSALGHVDAKVELYEREF